MDGWTDILMRSIGTVPLELMLSNSDDDILQYDKERWNKGRSLINLVNKLITVINYSGV